MPLNFSIKTTKLLSRKWSNDMVHRHVGNFRESYFAYSTDHSLRINAASGGIVTALFAYLLETKKIDGALVCRSKIEKGSLKPEFILAQDKDTLISSQGSIYTAVEFTRDAGPLIKDFNGKIAAVALPCDIQKLSQNKRRDPELTEKIVLSVSLFCGHNSRPELTEMIFEKLDKNQESIVDFHYRRGHWRGQLEVVLSSGITIKKPFSYFSDYQNLYYFCQKKCHYCHDHTGYSADISVGDIWSLRMKEEPIKHNAVIVRTKTGKEIFNNAIQAKWIVAKEEPIEEICKGQTRSLPFHYNVSARAKAGKLVGIQIKDDVYEHVRWNDFVVACMALVNEKLSRSNRGRKFITLMPRFVLKLLLYFMKGLESF